MKDNTAGTQMNSEDIHVLQQSSYPHPSIGYKISVLQDYFIKYIMLYSAFQLQLIYSKAFTRSEGSVAMGMIAESKLSIILLGGN